MNGRSRLADGTSRPTTDPDPSLNQNPDPLLSPPPPLIILILALFANLNSCARFGLGSMLGGLTATGSLLAVVVEAVLCADSGLAELLEYDLLNADGGSDFSPVLSVAARLSLGVIDGGAAEEVSDSRRLRVGGSISSMVVEDDGRSTLVLVPCEAIPMDDAGRVRPIVAGGRGSGPPALSKLARFARGTMSGGLAVDATAIDSRRLWPGVEAKGL